jgi:hypothetical protein
MSSNTYVRTSESAPPDIIRASYDWTITSPSCAIVETIADMVGADPCSLFNGGKNTLHDYVDTAALDALLGDVRTNIETIIVTVESYTVLLHKDGLVVAGFQEPSLQE